jgi:hypothetical protein
MNFFNTKINKELCKDNDLTNSVDEKNELERNKYIKIINDIHSSNIPTEIRTTEMNFDFKTDFSNLEICSLNKKIEEFLNWYYKNCIKDNYTNIDWRILQAKSIINFIEKMVSWYEMRYPNFEINRLMPCSGQENKYVDDILLNQGIDSIEWKDLFDYNAFIQTLACEEKKYLRKESFIRSYNMKDAYGTLYIENDGKVKTDEVRFDITEIHPNKILEKNLYVTEDFNGLNLLQVKELMKKYNMLNDALGIQEIIDNYQLQIEAKERLLDCVMYKIIDRGGNRIGPRRAFLFAKEFNRNIDIPMIYCIDYSDPGLRNFINYYLKAGGSKDLICCDNYFIKANKDELKTISVQELIKNTWNNNATKYNIEEDELHQRLIDVLVNQIITKQEPVLKKIKK